MRRATVASLPLTWSNTQGQQDQLRHNRRRDGLKGNQKQIAWLPFYQSFYEPSHLGYTHPCFRNTSCLIS